MIDPLVALRLHESPQIALVGSGGKTSWMFKLARALQLKYDSVILTTTTHLASWQLQFADHYRVVSGLADLPKDLKTLPQGLVLFTGPAELGERVTGLDIEDVTLLQEKARTAGFPLLIEADGSRQRPLKAPADYEPVLPDSIDGVVVVASLQGLDQRLNDKHVHRPEIFSELSGIALGARVSLIGLVRVLTDPNGGLKGIPKESRRIALLTQVDGAKMKAQASSMAEQMLGAYDAVLLGESTPSTTLSPVLDPAAYIDFEIHSAKVIAAHERIAGVVLAAGGSTRFEGQLKQLLDWDGVPIVRQVTKNAILAGLSPVVVVVGADGPAVEAALSGLSVEIVQNSNWKAGQSTSVRAGIQALSEEVGAAMFLLVDQPQIPVTLMRALMEKHRKTLAPIVAPLIDDDRGNPVLFDCRTFSAFDDVEGDVGGRSIFSRFQVTWIPWHDSRMRLDIDTQADYLQLKEAMGIEPTSDGALALNEG